MVVQEEHVPEEQAAPAAEQPPPTDLSPDELRQALDDARSQADRYLANWQRAQADFTNYRRRNEQERTEQAKYASAFLLVQLLAIQDDLERALSSVSPALAGMSWVEGIRLIYRKLQMVLEAQGLTEILAQGQRFDPSIHEAVHYADGEEGRVISVVQKGYRLYDRVIRPALVVVGKGGQDTSGEPSPPANEEQRTWPESSAST